MAQHQSSSSSSSLSNTSSTNRPDRPSAVQIELPFYDWRRRDTRIVLLDPSVWREASAHAWYLLGGDGKGKEYACTGSIHAPVYLHRFAYKLLHGLDDIPTDMCIDHISGEVHDNTGMNLRCISYSMNAMNKAKGVYKRGRCGSDYKGVWKKTYKKKNGMIITTWVGEVNVKGHKKRTKSFSEAQGGERAAALWYNEQVTELCPGVARLNRL